MSRPEFALIPILMFSDYFLTVAGAVLKERAYDRHFEIDSYELNPTWQTDIARKRWFNLRHALLTVLVTVLLFLIVESNYLPDPFLDAFFGCLCIVFGIIIGRHLSNLLIFVTIAHRAQDISGSVEMSQELTLWISTYQYIVVALPMLLVGIFSPTPFVGGGLVGVMLIFMMHLGWIRQLRKQGAPQARNPEIMPQSDSETQA